MTELLWSLHADMWAILSAKADGGAEEKLDSRTQAEGHTQVCTRGSPEQQASVAVPRAPRKGIQDIRGTQSCCRKAGNHPKD